MRLFWYDRDPDDGTQVWGCSWLVLIALMIAIVVVVALWD